MWPEKHIADSNSIDFYLFSTSNLWNIPCTGIYYACMKHLFVTILLFVSSQLVWGQTEPNSQLLTTDCKSPFFYYIDFKDPAAIVYTMGRFWDKGGAGYTIVKTDTLQQQPDSSYSGKHFRIILTGKGLCLVSGSKKKRTCWLHRPIDTNLANNQLNNAWYLRHYFDLDRELSEVYPLSYHDFREGFDTWEKLPEHEKNMPYLQFRAFADEKLKQMKDSITTLHGKCIILKNNIIQNIHSLDYNVLKDSLNHLLVVYGGPSRYFGLVIDTVALRYPEYFFRLAEDLPQHKQSILSNGIYNKQAFSGLASVEGHDEVKREFLKKRKEMRVSTYQAVGSAVVGYGLMAALIIILL